MQLPGSMRFCGYCGACVRPENLAAEDYRERVCATCGRVFRVASGPALLVLAFVFAENKLLLLRRGLSPYRGQWAPPGGFVEAGESLEAAAVRETREEVGITLSPEQFIPHGCVSLPALNQVYVVFLAVLEDIVPLSPSLPEALDAKWFSQKDYPTRDIWEPGNDIDVNRLFERVRTGRFDFYQQTDSWLRVVSTDTQMDYLWRR